VLPAGLFKPAIQPERNMANDFIRNYRGNAGRCANSARAEESTI
jgi:hypothetical protein